MSPTPLWMCMLAFLVRTSAPTLISNMNLVFETFNPVSMVRFFEFNDKGWNISAACIQDMFYYLDGLHRDVRWAVKLYDASGYYSGGLLDQNHIRPGNPDLCRHLNADFVEHERLYHQQPIFTRMPTPSPAPNQPTVHQFRSFSNDSRLPPFGVRLVNAKYRMAMETGSTQPGITGKSINILQTVCMPSACTFDDLKQVMSYAHLPQMRNNIHVRNVELVELRLIQSEYTLWTDLSFSVILTITAVILLVITCATVYEKFAFLQDKPLVAERFSMKTSFISHVSVDKVSTSQTSNESNSIKTNNLKSIDSVLVDSLVLNNISIDKLDNITQAKSLESTAPSTRIDVWNQNTIKRKHDQLKSSHTPPVGLVAKLITSFSWSSNCSHLFGGSHRNTTKLACDYEDDLAVVSGLRVICCLSIIAVHLCVFLTQVSNNKRFEKDNALLSLLAANGSVSIDIYFFLSGISMAHLFYTTAKIIDVHQICGAIDQLLLFASMIMYKLIRLTFPYLVVLILLQLTMKHFHDYAVVTIPSEDHATCQEHMWKNILYIDTFFPVTERCMVWSWYISLEAQFCVVSSIILMLAKNHPKYASIISASFFTSSIVTTTILRYDERAKNHFHAEAVQTSSSMTYEEELIHFNGVYDQPWTRVSPYLLGLCLGYILHRSKHTVKLRFWVVIMGWLACISLVAGFALKQLYVDRLSLWIRAAVASITHTMWSMVLFWIILSSVSPYKGLVGRFLLSRKWTPLSKLTNCVLLVHPLVTRWIILNMDSSIHISLSIYVIMYIGFVVLIYSAAFVLFVVFEAPFTTIFHVIYNRNFK